MKAFSCSAAQLFSKRTSWDYVCCLSLYAYTCIRTRPRLSGAKVTRLRVVLFVFFDEASSLLFYVITSSDLEGFFLFYVLALTLWDRSGSQRLRLLRVIIQSSSDRSPLCLRVRSYAINLPRGSNSYSTLSHLFHRVCPSTCLPFILVSYDILYWHLLCVLSQGVASFIQRGTSKSFWNIIL